MFRAIVLKNISTQVSETETATGCVLYCSIGLRPTTVLKKILWHRRFPVNFAKYLTTPFLQNTSVRLLLAESDFGKEKCKALSTNSKHFVVPS